MTFWQKFWKLVSKKHLIFGVLLFAAVIALSLSQSAEAVTVTFGDSAVDIAASRFSMNIPYDMVDHAELVEIPDRGDVIDGTDDMAVRTGQWTNDTWGEYFVCADLDASNCIAVHLNDGRIFVFSRKDNAETAQIFETFQTYLNLQNREALLPGFLL